MREGDLIRFLQERIEAMGFTAEQGSARRIAEKSGFDNKQALSALDRLFTYCLDEKKIVLKDIQEICYDMQGDLYFAFIDALAERKTDAAIKKLNRHRFADGAILLAGIVKLFSDALRFHRYARLGFETKSIHKRLGLNTNHAFVMKKNQERFQALVRNYEVGQIKSILASLCKLDIRLKENPSLKDQKVILIFFIASLAG